MLCCVWQAVRSMMMLCPARPKRYIHTYVSRALCRVTRKTKKTSEWKYFEENDWGVVQIIKQNVLYLSKFIYLLIFVNALIIKKIRSLLKFDLAGRDCWRGRAVLLSRGVRSRWRHPGVPAVMSGRHVGSTWAAPRATWYASLTWRQRWRGTQPPPAYFYI